jgi:hypothetical protein
MNRREALIAGAAVTLTTAGVIAAEKPVPKHTPPHNTFLRSLIVQLGLQQRQSAQRGRQVFGGAFDSRLESRWTGLRPAQTL